MQTDPIVRIPSLPMVTGVTKEGQRQPGGRSFADTMRRHDGEPEGSAGAAAGAAAGSGAGADEPMAPLESDGATIRKSSDGALHVDVLV